MNNPSIKKFTTQEIETAIGQALTTLTGWDDCKVEIESIDFITVWNPSTHENTKTKLNIHFSNRLEEGKNFPF